MNREAYMKLIEEISLNAWPSHKIELYDGWLIRFSHNYTHRTNSVQQVGASSIPVEEKVAYCEAMYANYHTPAIFKISPLLDPAFDRMLEERGYEIQHTTEVMTMDLKKLNAYEPLSVEYEYYGRNSGLPSSIYYPDETIVQLRDGGCGTGHSGPWPCGTLCDLCGRQLPEKRTGPLYLQLDSL